ncbi:C6 finger domain-containing protein [Metarhizium album ARSEF 1941]|uniref:C6 finger domain-containing protein n=1 Tax=Metarhizium album (strain ARSEF 1941) TaxID=1081103 RepID=A0A0B2WU98_METAS|nr:C6 finger domain-containing protein [Metarhizium album ARSEF 1941]KHN99646.1 C6 finger domain-containing protein [Metarhizium album ARSEF 1941]
MGGRSESAANGPGFVQPGQKRPAKLFHKKSRTGCQRCRARRCDEAKPICSNCTRLQLACLYDRVGPAGPPPPSPPSGSSSSAATKETPDAEGVVDPPESEARRKLELSLLHQYFSETGPSIAVDAASRPFWVDMASELAFKCDALLYALLLLAALHRARKPGCPDERQSLHQSSTYLGMTLRELGREIAHLSASNVDGVCLAASMLRVYAFVRFQDRELEPYTPPTSWLRMTGTSGAVFRQSAAITSMDPGSLGMRMADLVADLLDGDESHASGLAHLMRRQHPHELAEAPWDADVQAAYLSALNYIGAVWRAMRDRRPPGSVARRLIVFPLFVHARFVDMVDEERPRALVIVAHYFALLAMLRGLWWVGDAGPREVRAIAKQLPPEWRGALDGPLEILEDHVVFTPDMEVDRLAEYAARLRLRG